LNRKDLARKFAEKAQIKPLLAADPMVNDLFDIIKEEVVAGNTVAITGFGKFAPYVRQNGEVKPKFTPYQEFKDSVKGG